MKTKQEQIEEIANLMANTMAKNFGLRYKDFAEMIYKAGYRKTFTSDTQKAFKEGYEKGCETCAQAWDNGYNDGYESGKEDGVKEFAEKVKGKSEMFLVAKDNGVYGEKLYVSIEEIDELLKEYE